MSKPVDEAQMARVILDELPQALDRFRKAGHREVRVSLFVESTDPLAENHTQELPVAMIPLLVLRASDLPS